jgi:hypothetical protein
MVLAFLRSSRNGFDLNCGNSGMFAARRRSYERGCSGSRASDRAGNFSTFASGNFSRKRPVGSSTCHRVAMRIMPASSVNRVMKSSMTQFHALSRLFLLDASARPLMGSSITPRFRVLPVICPFTVVLRKLPFFPANSMNFELRFGLSDSVTTLDEPMIVSGNTIAYFSSRICRCMAVFASTPRSDENDA